MVRAAQGQSILRLPWFEEELFVGRQLPDVSEIPEKIRLLAVDNYCAALTGERTDYAFTSYGHRYSVDAVPVRGEDERSRYVLAVAMPGRSSGSAASETERVAQRLLDTAELAEQRANEYRAQGRGRAALAQGQRAHAARSAAERAAVNAHRLRMHSTSAPPNLTPREVDVLTLASHGFSYSEIAEQLVLTAATVKTHLAHCYVKLDVPDKAAAVAAALRHGLIE